MALEGELSGVNLVDVLYLVGFAGKTGVVRFTGSGWGLSRAGAIYFRDGQPVAAETDELTGLEALETLCSWDAGSFQFHDGATTPRENLVQPFEQLVEMVRTAVEDWRLIHESFPTETGVVSMSPQLPAEMQEVRLSRADWAVLVSMSSPQPLPSLAELGGGGLRAYRRLRRLTDEGLLKFESR